MKIDANRICEGQVVNGELRSGAERAAKLMKRMLEWRRGQRLLVKDKKYCARQRLPQMQRVFVYYPVV